MNQEFFDKHKVALNEEHALELIADKAKEAKKYYEKGKDYEECLKELSAIIDDFFMYK